MIMTLQHLFVLLIILIGWLIKWEQGYRTKLIWTITVLALCVGSNLFVRQLDREKAIETVGFNKGYCKIINRYKLTQDEAYAYCVSGVADR